MKVLNLHPFGGAARTGLAAALAALLGTTGLWAAEYDQAPMLDALVESGDLPPVEDRLPKSPLIFETLESIGEYGGTLRRAILGGGDQHNIVRTIGHENLVRWSADWTEVKPNIAESWTVSEDATTFTFKLREGMRWSDGAPFTADDIMFWYEVFSDERLTPSKHAIYVGPEGPVEVRKIDDTTVEFKFASPNGLFIQNLAYGFGYYPVNYPKHYLSQFHEAYNPDGIQALIDAEPAAGDWVSLFTLKAGQMHTPAFWQNADRPTLHPWKLKNAYGSSDRVVAERNPYFWKVDAEGNQLPYFDSITWDQVEDPETILLKAFNGEIDYMNRHLGRPANRAVLTDNMERGKYHFFDTNDLPSNGAILMLNLNNPDPVKNEIVNNKDFRVGISHAVNRQEIIDLIYFGSGRAAQTAPQPVSPLYNERMATQFVEYDPDLANEYLDKVLPEKDAEGYRLDPDGNRFTLVFLTADVFGAQFPDVMELVAAYAGDVGLDFQVRVSDRARLQEIAAASEHDAYIWNCAGGQSDAYTSPECYLPFGQAVYWAPEWAKWGVDKSTGIEPPEHIKALFTQYDLVKSAATDEARKAEMDKLLEMSADQFLTIGLVQSDPAFGVARNNVKNAPDPLPISGQLWYPSPYVSQMYYEGGKSLP
ncbi:ABC transporter substrate-binding protein [Vannielia litorea]|uniref:Peptide/nickel transport system substrate-binding protein n=1 Tax=Vannielia litorea TaxID=1217970 RepID=A0A1N6DZX1_9RHOB|nr:ABC transporter substrate-binding protein [Vannielia litorea]SIN76326.1 peptide/nickel transport system substrate-binding protein [Vannielia litorea]